MDGGRAEDIRVGAGEWLGRRGGGGGQRDGMTEGRDDGGRAGS